MWLTFIFFYCLVELFLLELLVKLFKQCLDFVQLCLSKELPSCLVLLYEVGDGQKFGVIGVEDSIGDFG